RLPLRGVLGLPCDPRDEGRRSRRARPHAPADPHDARRGHDPEQQGGPGGLGARPAAREAWQQDAGPAACGRATPGPPRLPGVAPLVAVDVYTPEAQRRVHRLETIWEARPGFLGWLTTVDHKRIGLLFFFTSVAFFVAGGIEALTIRTQLAEPSSTVVGPKTFNELMTMHGTTMIFLFVVPMGLGAFGNYLVPLMVGARALAFPRLNALSYWIFLASGLFIYVGLAIG